MQLATPYVWHNLLWWGAQIAPPIAFSGDLGTTLEVPLYLLTP